MSLDSFVEMKDWRLDYFLREGSHQLEFRIIGDSARFSFEGPKGRREKNFEDISFRLDLTSCKPKHDELSGLLFKFKKMLLRVFLFWNSLSNCVQWVRRKSTKI